MARIKEEKKTEKRKRILEKSKELFFTKGYEKTSIKQIAFSAGIAEGTIYNYFNSKSDIFLEIISEQHYADFDEKKEDYLNNRNKPLEVIYNMIANNLMKLLLLPKEIFKEFIILSYRLAFENKESMKMLVQADYKFLEALEILIKDLIKRQMIKECDSKVFSEIIFGIMTVEIIGYAHYDNDLSREDMLDNLKKKIDFCLKGYI